MYFNGSDRTLKRLTLIKSIQRSGRMQRLTTALKKATTAWRGKEAVVGKRGKTKNCLKVPLLGAGMKQPLPRAEKQMIGPKTGQPNTVINMHENNKRGKSYLQRRSDWLEYKCVK